MQFDFDSFWFTNSLMRQSHPGVVFLSLLTRYICGCIRNSYCYYFTNFIHRCSLDFACKQLTQNREDIEKSFFNFFFVNKKNIEEFLLFRNALYPINVREIWWNEKVFLRILTSIFFFFKFSFLWIFIYI